MSIIEKIEGVTCRCDVAGTRSGLVGGDTAMTVIAGHVGAVVDVDEAALVGATDRRLAGPNRARAAMPRFNPAAMGGFALRGAVPIAFLQFSPG